MTGEPNQLNSLIDALCESGRVSRAAIARAAGIAPDHLNHILKQPRRQTPQGLAKVAAGLSKLFDRNITAENILTASVANELKELSHSVSPQPNEPQEASMDWRDVLIEDVLGRLPGGLPEYIERGAKAEARRRLAAHSNPKRRMRTEK